ncbi:hypothetical protein [Paracoccus sediminilitoris]|uniref:hypothetical protein n=1 Tax=Paracoccus sediminilitoris TaxID=2202419 RepID=UPI00272A53E5|nr:hypothetical protein [Paracoccus sediminilitoris]
MAIFTYLATTAFWTSVTATIGTTAAGAIITAGQAVTWSIASALLAKPQMSRQEMMATLSQTDRPRVRAYGRNLMGGNRAFFEAQDGSLLQIVVFHHGQVDGLIRFWVDGEPVQLDGANKLNRYTQFLFRDGSGIGGDYSEVLSRFPALWTAAHRLQNQATFQSAFGDPSDEDFPKFYPRGSQTQVQVEIRGSRVRNMAGAEIYSENAGICIRDLLTHPDGWNIPVDRLNAASWQAFVNLCGQAVPVAAGGTEMRYRLCGYYTLNDPLKEVTGRMLATCDGQIYETAEGEIGILGGAWSEPDVTITGADILSVQMADGFDPFTDYNVLKGSFVSPDHGYQPTEIAELRDEASLLTQEERLQTYEVEMCPSHSQLQRLAKIKLAKDRREHVGTLRTNLVGLKARFPKGDGIHTIRIDAPEFGLDAVFEVTSHGFDIVGGFCEIGIASIANPYGWSTAQEKPLPPTIDDLGKPANFQLPPANAALVQQVVEVSGDVSGVKLVVSVDDPGRDGLALKAQVAAGDHAADAAAPWVEMAAQGNLAETGVLDDLQTYTVRVKWRGRSEWIRAGGVKVIANPSIPPAPTAFDAVATRTNVYLDWRNPQTGFWRTQIWRNTTADFASATLIATVSGNAGQPSNFTDELPAGASGTRRYWAVNINPSRVPSTEAGPATVTL